MKYFEKAVIIGATSAIAHEVARLLVQNSTRKLILVGRNSEKLEQNKLDLKALASPVDCEIETIVQDDFSDVSQINETVNSCVQGTSPNLVFIAHGFMPAQEDCQKDLGLTSAALIVNGVSPCLFAEAFAERLQYESNSTIAVIGSVAGDRGRLSNYVYGAGKGLIETFLQGLMHRFGLKGPKISLIKPGPTLSPMTAGLDEKKLASPKDVASTILKGVSKEQRVIYAPRKWKLIMIVVKNLPYFIFNKLKI